MKTILIILAIAVSIIFISCGEPEPKIGDTRVITLENGIGDIRYEVQYAKRYGFWDGYYAWDVYYGTTNLGKADSVRKSLQEHYKRTLWEKK